MNNMNVTSRVFTSPQTSIDPIWSIERLQTELKRLDTEFDLCRKQLYQKASSPSSKGAIIINKIVDKEKVSPEEWKEIAFPLQLFLMTIDPAIKDQKEIIQLLKSQGMKSAALLYFMLEENGFYPFVLCERLLPLYSNEEIQEQVNDLAAPNGARYISIQLIAFLAVTAGWSKEQKNRFFTSLFAGIVDYKETFLGQMHLDLPAEQIKACCAQGGEVLQKELLTFTKMCDGHLETMQQAIQKGHPLDYLPADNRKTLLYLLSRLLVIYEKDMDKFAYVARVMDAEGWKWLKEHYFPMEEYGYFYLKVDAYDVYNPSMLFDSEKKKLSSVGLQVLSWISSIASIPRYTLERSTFYWHASDFLESLKIWKLVPEPVLQRFVRQIPAVVFAVNFGNFNDSFLKPILDILIKQLPDKFQEFCLYITQQEKSTKVNFFKLLQELNLLEYALTIFNNGKLPQKDWINLFCDLSKSYQEALLKNLFEASMDDKGIKLFCDCLVTSQTKSQEFSPRVALLFVDSLRQKLSKIDPSLPQKVATELRTRNSKELTSVISDLELDEKRANDPHVKQKGAIEKLTKLFSPNQPITEDTLKQAKVLAQDLDITHMEGVKRVFSAMPQQTWPLLFVAYKMTLPFRNKDFLLADNLEWWKQTMATSLKESFNPSAQNWNLQIRFWVRNEFVELILATKSSREVLTECLTTYSPPQFFALLAELKASESTIRDNSLYKEAKGLLFVQSTNKVETVTAILYDYWRAPLLHSNTITNDVLNDLFVSDCSSDEQEKVAMALIEKEQFSSFFYFAAFIRKELVAALYRVDPNGLSLFISSHIAAMMASLSRASVKKECLLYFLEGAAHVQLDPLQLISKIDPEELVKLFRENFTRSDLSSLTYLQVILLKEDDFCEFLLNRLNHLISQNNLSTYHLRDLFNNLSLLNKKELFIKFVMKDEKKKPLRQFIEEDFADCCKAPALLGLVVAIIPDWKERLKATIDEMRKRCESAYRPDYKPLNELRESLRVANVPVDLKNLFPELTEEKMMPTESK